MFSPVSIMNLRYCSDHLAGDAEFPGPQVRISCEAVAPSELTIPSLSLDQKPGSRRVQGPVLPAIAAADYEWSDEMLRHIFVEVNYITVR